MDRNPQQVTDGEQAWEAVLESLCRLQTVLPDAVLVGGTASALYAHHRFSFDHDHVLPDLKQRFDSILSELEAVTGWQTERVNRPVQILGSLDGVETGVRQLRRSRPLETTTMEVGGHSVLLPTLPEVLRIKAFLVVDRNAARDYLDLGALSSHIGIDKAALSLWRMDELYPQKNDDAWAVRSQLIMQLAAPRPYDLDKVNLAEYKGVKAPFDRWESIAALCGKVSDSLLELCRENLTATPSAGAQQAITKIVSWREAQGSPQPLPLPKLPGLKS